MVAVDGGWHGNFFSPGLHELQDRHLAGHVLVDDPIRVEHDVTFAGVKFGAVGIV